MLKHIALAPKLSEKTYAISELTNTYVFEAPKNANKHDIARAVAAQYDVKVAGVRIANIPGKVKRSVRRGGRNVFRGSRTDTRKAFVTLVEGDKLPIFSAIEEAANQPEAK
jgi:ribosomal protein L23